MFLSIGTGLKGFLDDSKLYRRNLKPSVEQGESATYSNKSLSSPTFKSKYFLGCTS